MVRFSDEMNRFGGGWLTFLHNLSTSIFYWQWHFFIICLRLSSIFSVERHKVQFYVLIQPQIGSYPYLIFVDLMIVTNMSYALTVMIRPQRSCLGPWIISQEVPGNDTSEHNPFKKYLIPFIILKHPHLAPALQKKISQVKRTETKSASLQTWRSPKPKLLTWGNETECQMLIEHFDFSLGTKNLSCKDSTRVQILSKNWSTTLHDRMYL